MQRMKRVADENRLGMHTVGIVRQSSTIHTSICW